jgi:hypothetical protein
LAAIGLAIGEQKAVLEDDCELLAALRKFVLRWCIFANIVSVTVIDKAELIFLKTAKHINRSNSFNRLEKDLQ